MPRLPRSLLSPSTLLARPTTASISFAAARPIHTVIPSQSINSTPLRSARSSFPNTSRLSTPLSTLSITANLGSQPMQVRYIALGNFYQPSQRKRKRKHGFLARLRSVGGRKMLKRRAMKGRRFLSH